MVLFTCMICHKNRSTIHVAKYTMTMDPMFFCFFVVISVEDEPVAGGSRRMRKTNLGMFFFRRVVFNPTKDAV